MSLFELLILNKLYPGAFRDFVLFIALIFVSIIIIEFLWEIWIIQIFLIVLLLLLINKIAISEKKYKYLKIKNQPHSFFFS